MHSLLGPGSNNELTSSFKPGQSDGCLSSVLPSLPSAKKLLCGLPLRLCSPESEPLSLLRLRISATSHKTLPSNAACANINLRAISAELCVAVSTATYVGLSCCKISVEHVLLHGLRHIHLSRKVWFLQKKCHLAYHCQAGCQFPQVPWRFAGELHLLLT